MPNSKCTTSTSTSRCSSPARSERRELKLPQGEFDAAKDILFFDDVPQTYYTLRPGQFTVLFPEDGHAPMVGEGTVRKIIVKVRK